MVCQQDSRRAVENDVVEIDIDVVSFTGPVDLNAEQRILQQIHGAAEAGTHVVNRSDFLDERMPFVRRVVFDARHSFFQHDARQGIGMGPDHCLESVGEAVDVDGVGKMVQGGLLVVASVFIQALAGQIDAQLGVGKRVRHIGYLYRLYLSNLDNFSEFSQILPKFIV